MVTSSTSGDTFDYIVQHFWNEFEKLHRDTPRVSLPTYVNENSDFTAFTDGCKNCYLLANAWNNEDVMYGRAVSFSKDCADCVHVDHCTLSYECVDCGRCYNCAFLQNCEDCRDCEYGYDLKGCSNCFGCAGLRHKEFHIFNRPYVPDLYRAEVLRLKGRHSDVLKKFSETMQAIPRQFANMVNCEGCIGDYSRNSKDCFYCFDMESCRDCMYCLACVTANDMLDTEFSEYASFNYECISAWKLHNSQYCTFCWESSDLEYCENVFRSQHCFGCVYLNHREYCILNKQYSRDDYFRLKELIKVRLRESGVYGRRFLPSTYPVADTVAHMPI